MKRLFGIAATFLCLAATVRAADVSELTQKLKDKDTDNRRAAAQALAEMGAEAKPAVSALTASLKDSDLFVRRFSAMALGKIGADAKDAVPSLSAILRDGKEKKEVQEAAALALGDIGPAGINALIAAVKDHNKDTSVRRNAVLGLSKMGPEAKSAIPTLIAELNGKDGATKKNPMPDNLKSDLVSALGEIATAKDDNAIKAIEALTEGKGGKKDKNLVKAVQEAVRKIKGRNS
jgi:HEAT repeat protein